MSNFPGQKQLTITLYSREILFEMYIFSFVFYAILYLMKIFVNSMAPPNPSVIRIPAIMFPMRMRPMDFQ